MSAQYDELRAIYMAAKADFDRMETELAIARAKMRAAERAAIAEWRNLIDADKLGAIKGAALSSTHSQAPTASSPVDSTPSRRHPE